MQIYGGAIITNPDPDYPDDPFDPGPIGGDNGSGEPDPDIDPGEGDPPATPPPATPDACDEEFDDECDWWDATGLYELFSVSWFKTYFIWVENGDTYLALVNNNLYVYLIVRIDGETNGITTQPEFQEMNEFGNENGFGNLPGGGEGNELIDVP